MSYIIIARNLNHDSAIAQTEVVSIKRVYDALLEANLVKGYTGTGIAKSLQETAYMSVVEAFLAKYADAIGEYRGTEPEISGFGFGAFIDGRLLDSYDFIADGYATILIQIEEN